MLGHQGGWDEIGLFLIVPTSWVVFLLVRERIRRRRERDEERDG